MFFSQQEGGHSLQPQKQQQPQSLAEADPARKDKQLHEQQQQQEKSCPVNQRQQQMLQTCL